MKYISKIKRFRPKKVRYCKLKYVDWKRKYNKRCKKICSTTTFLTHLLAIAVVQLKSFVHVQKKNLANLLIL